MTGSALVRAAKKARRLAQAANDADREFTRLLEVRYGLDAHSELTDELVEVIRYGNGSQKITLRWLDAVILADHGLSPQNASVDLTGDHCGPNSKKDAPAG